MTKPVRGKPPKAPKSSADKPVKEPKKPLTAEEKKAAEEAKAKKKAAISGANTRTQAYIDHFNNSGGCENDRKKVAEKCAPKPEHKKLDERTRKGGLLRHARQVLSRVDGVGKSYYKYQKGSPATNQWMDDHCDGMWVKPQFSDMEGFEEQLKTFKGELDALGKTVDYYLKNPGTIGKAALEQLTRQAMDKLGADEVANMAYQKLAKDAGLALLPTGKAGLLGKAATIGKAGISASGYLEMGEKLVTAIGTDHAKEILDGMKFLVREGQERLGELVKVWEEKPDAVMAEMMSIAAEFDSCLRAKKCQLVPYKSNTKDNAAKGAGCCPGQTAHHVIPDSAAKDAGCEHYSYTGAPTICLEGQDNNYGSHGRAHTKLGESITDYNGLKKPPKPISYTDMRDKSLAAISHATVPQCSHECLQGQLDAYYKNCGNLIAKSGKGGAIPSGSEDKNEVTPDR